ncbi:MAG: hypothetical protein KF795_27355 [Labilithrix sp.]|nr:hypothetical protein [Labilithrix sp.]
MKSYVAALLVLAPLAGLGTLVGCAEGTDADPSEAYLAASPVEAGAAEEEDESVKLPAPSNPPAPGDDDDDDADADAGKTGTDAGTDSGTPPPPPPPPPPTGGSCASPNVCAAATHLGSVSGDTGADVKSAQGHTSQWFTVRVTENDSGLAGVQLWMTASLTSPPGTNYDLYVYVPATDTLECSAVSYQSTSSSATDSVTAKFGESGLFSNGSDDDRTVTVEVRHVSGTCDSANKWTLNLYGNK